MTKHNHDDILKCNLTVEDVKIDIAPKIIENAFIAVNTHLPKPRDKLDIRMANSKMNVKKSRLEKATEHLYDLEEDNAPEKPLNVDFDLFQMEDY